MSNVTLHPEFFVMLAGILSGGIGASLFLLQLFHGFNRPSGSDR